jgi:SAM-dependent methyltransferase
MRYIWEGEMREGDDPSLYHQARMLAGTAYPSEDIVPPEQLAASLFNNHFDLIFFDPLHVRPEVDRTIKILCGLLKPGGILVLHDCNPEDEALTSVSRPRGAWMGETYKAFANFHQHNPKRSLTIDVDYGVGVIVNNDLVLDFDDEFDLSYSEFSADRVSACGLTSWGDFITMVRTRSSIFHNT